MRASIPNMPRRGALQFVKIRSKAGGDVPHDTHCFDVVGSSVCRSNYPIMIGVIKAVLPQLFAGVEHRTEIRRVGRSKIAEAFFNQNEAWHFVAIDGTYFSTLAPSLSFSHSIFLFLIFKIKQEHNITKTSRH